LSTSFVLDNQLNSKTKSK